ncbi:centromere protein Chl4/mis15/CENP-N [Bombardia bombarda]|uniref:Centromere protein Chl4/mis15/CENP-N n=1 Tax=Bombardia bombarda TaxID=252184 RepID=A0AA39WD32_9PEZI|nr:centromere protein Chl4/mis15/CENP-N [Bombardia bombarda]
MARISIPTTSRLPSSLRVDASNPLVAKVLNRLSRASLLTIALDWLDENNLYLSAPYLLPADDDDDEDEETDDFNPPARSLAALQELYTSLQTRKGPKREVIDRIAEGDWRHGLSLYQLAMVDLQYLYDRPMWQWWTAYRIVPLKPLSQGDDDDDAPQSVIDKESLLIPRFHPSTFLKALQAQVLPDVKAHYNFDRHRDLPVLLLRIFILDSPYNTSLSLGSGSGNSASSNKTTTSSSNNITRFDTSRTVYIAFPDDSPHIFISKPQTQTLSGGPAGGAGAGAGAGGGESKSLRNLIVEGIPKALSRPRERVTLKSTSLTTNNLTWLLDRCGAARTNSAAGGWSVYADEDRRLETPLDVVLPSPPLSDVDGDRDGGGKEKVREDGGRAGVMKRAVSPGGQRDERNAKRARLVARARFADTGMVGDGKGVGRVDVVVEDAFPVVVGGEDGRDDGGEEQQESISRGGAGGGRKSTVQAALERDGDDDDDVAMDDASGVAAGWRPNVRLTFHGSHVFAGVRQLVEMGIIDGERMPGWMTGEEGVTIGAVRNGRIRGHKGSGV